MHTSIETPHAPAPIGPYSQAVLAGNTLYVSGQIGIDPQTGVLHNTASIQTETECVLRNLQAILTAAGFTLADVVKCSIFIRDMNDFAAINTVYAQFFDQSKPARETVAVAGLPKDVRVEISCIAVKPNR
ncbi:MAG: RidA family protein [Bernardetiaceae bacterium]